MTECIRGFMQTKGGATRASVIKRFRENAERANIEVVSVAFCQHIGMNVFSIVANIKLPDQKATRNED
jgi:hypothetical protein